MGLLNKSESLLLLFAEMERFPRPGVPEVNVFEGGSFRIALGKRLVALDGPDCYDAVKDVQT